MWKVKDGDGDRVVSVVLGLIGVYEVDWSEILSGCFLLFQVG
jgi:hypothetical protein